MRPSRIFIGTKPKEEDIDLPALTIKSLLIAGDKTSEGTLIEFVAIPWFEIMAIIEKDPAAIYQIDCWKWEEIIAGAYKQAGFDKVELTPRSGDKGRDVVATKTGVGSIRIFDQVKAYSPNNLVPANDVRALAGILSGAGNVSKGVITTTSDFAPRIAEDEYIKPLIPHRIELRPKSILLPWLKELSTKK
jgi:restriction system protein